MTECNYTGWNHRVMRRTYTPPGYDEPIHLYSIHEVYYSPDGSVATYTKDGVRPQGESLDELREELEMFINALGQPILPYGED